MTDPEPWETSAAGLFVTIRAGGPLDGLVTLNAISEGHGRTLVVASWFEDGRDRQDSVEVETFEHARALAHSIADRLAAGIPPDLLRE